jgi:hypothetical protein
MSLADSTERWDKYKQCMCYDVSQGEFCGYDEDLGIGLSALKQCLPYIVYLLKKMLPVVIGNLSLFFLFFVFLISRYACGVFGGGRPSLGLFLAKKRIPFDGYRYSHVWIAKGLALLCVGAIIGSSYSGYAYNAQLYDLVGRTVNHTRTDLNVITSASQLALTLFSDLSFFHDFSSLTRILNTVNEYTGDVGDAMNYVEMADGQTFAFGRTQLVSIIFGVVLTIVGLAFILGLFNISIRGFIHNFLGAVLGLATFGLVGVAIFHLVLYCAFEDSHRYFLELENSVTHSATEICGQTANASIARLKDIAVNDFFSMTCGPGGGLQVACATYFNCSGFDICWMWGHREPVSVNNLTTAMSRDLLVVNGSTPVPYKNIISCALSPTCFGLGQEVQNIAKQAFEQCAGVYAIIHEIEDKVEPNVNCQIGFSAWSVLLVDVEDLAEASYNLMKSCYIFLAFTWIFCYALVPASKRFTSRNHRKNLEERRAKRRQRNKRLVEQAVANWMLVDPSVAEKVGNLSMVDPEYLKAQLAREAEQAALEVDPAFHGDGPDHHDLDSHDDSSEDEHTPGSPMASPTFPPPPINARSISLTRSLSTAPAAAPDEQRPLLARSESHTT